MDESNTLPRDTFAVNPRPTGPPKFRFEHAQEAATAAAVERVVNEFIAHIVLGDSRHVATVESWRGTGETRS